MVSAEVAGLTTLAGATWEGRKDSGKRVGVCIKIGYGNLADKAFEVFIGTADGLRGLNDWNSVSGEWSPEDHVY